MRVYVTTNSPGEVATWVKPVTEQLAAYQEATGQPVDVYVFLTPCRYASGQEPDVLQTLPNVRRVFSTRETAWYALTGKRPAGLVPDGKGVLLFLGGEIALAALLSRRLGVPATLYTEGFIHTARAFARVYVPYEQARQRVVQRGASAERVRIVGNLMIDAVASQKTSRQEACAALGLDPSAAVVTVFPGSRTFEWKVLLPFYMQVVSELRDRIPKLQAVVAVSPFATDLAAAYDLNLVEGRPYVACLEGERVVVISHRSELAIQAADLVLTLPGSNTLEIAALERAMVVSLPLYHLEEIPLDGIAGMVGRIPWLGPALKRYAVRKFSERTPFAALPNRIAGRYIAPELRGENLQPWEVTAVAYPLLIEDDVRERMAKDLHLVVGGPGAARAIVDDLASLAWA